MPRSLKKGPYVNISLLKKFKLILIQTKKVLLRHGLDLL